jgi:outer membrane protein assembly factor BamB
MVVQGIHGTHLSMDYNYDNENLQITIEKVTDWWPMYQHDQYNSGFSSSIGPATNSILWMFNASGTVYSPSVSEGLIYVGTENTSMPYFSNSVLYCIDMNGNKVWSFTIDDELDSTPAINSGKVYIGGKSGTIYSLDSKSGELCWKVSTGESKLTSPIIMDEKIFIASLDGTIHCLDCKDGSPHWRRKIGMNIRCSPAVINEKLLIGNYCIDTNNGNIIWNSEIGLPLLSSPSVHSTMVFIGSINELFYCHDLETGKKVWDQYIGSMQWQYSPAIAYNKVYVGNAFGFIYCLDIETGDELWTTKNSARAVTSPAIADGKLYIGSYDTTFYCLDAYNGSTIWSYDAEEPWYYSPAIADGKVFVSNGHTLYCFGANINNASKLSIEGALNWSKVKPGSLIEGSFKVKNSGQTGSKLSWAIISYPSWGDWTINPETGNNLSPTDEAIKVQVQVLSPNTNKNTFVGEILIINKDNENDFVQLNVTLSTSRTNYRIANQLQHLRGILYSLGLFDHDFNNF